MPDTPIPTPAIDAELRERVLSLGLARRLADPVQPQSVDAEMLDALREAEIQIEYLHGRFAETGTGNAVLARIRAAIARAEVRS